MRKRTTALHALLVGLVLAVSLGACSTDAPGSDGAADASADSADAVDLAPFRAALARTEAAAALDFSARVRAAVGDGVIEVLLDGSLGVDGQTLVVTTDGGSVTYVVADGLATVDRGEGPVPIDLAEVPDTPSLASLGDLLQARIVAPGIVSGTIQADAVFGSTAAPERVAVTVRFDEGGFVTGFELEAPNGTFQAAVTYRNVVA